MRTNRRFTKTVTRERPAIKVKEVPPEDRTIRDYAKKFIEIMKTTSGFVDGVTLAKKFEEAGWHLKHDVITLWRVWRQVEHDCKSEVVQFIPQSCVHWTRRPSGWRFMGWPAEDDMPRKRKKRY